MPICGALGAGWLADKFAARHYHWLPLIPAAAYLMAIPAVLLATTSSNWVETLIFFAIPLFAFQSFHPIAILLVQNRMPANQRSMATSVLLLFISLGIGAGVSFVGLASDFFVEQWGVDSLSMAFSTLVPIFLLAIFMQWRASRHILKAAPVIEAK